ncbi:MAG: 30S ribosomal protein S6--L-glutamate ligase [Rhodothalassiaceae bacterium]
MNFRVGWEEWIALPGLGVPAIRAKIDTGAQSSALHAFAINPFRRKGEDWVRFGLHPLPERPDIELHCEAPLAGQRDVTSSNGETELRFIIRTEISVGGRSWESEISLTNRETMAFRMLLGRRALEEGVLVDVTTSLVHGTADLSIYDKLPHVRKARTSLLIACLLPHPDGPDAERLLEAAEARGHRMEFLDPGRAMVPLGMTGAGAGKRPDRVLPWAPPDMILLAMLRRLEAHGARSLNGSAALAIAADPLHLFQRLAERGIKIPPMIVTAATDDRQALSRAIGGAPARLRPLGGPADGIVCAPSRTALHALLDLAGRTGQPLLLEGDFRDAARFGAIVVGRQAVAGFRMAKDGISAAKLSPDSRRLAIQAVRALGLRVAAVEMLETAQGPLCVDVRPSFNLLAMEEMSGTDIASSLLSGLEMPGRGARR